MALWDIKGKVAGLPVWALLGGKARERVDLYAHVQASTIEATVERAQAAVESGFKAVRFGFDHPDSADGFDAFMKLCKASYSMFVVISSAAWNTLLASLPISSNQKMTGSYRSIASAMSPTV